MATTQTAVLKRLKESGIGIIPINNNLSDEEDCELRKLESFGVIEEVNRAYRPTARFYRYADKLIAEELPVEQFNFDDQPSAYQTVNNTFHAQNIGQINQGSGNFSFDQINIEIIKNSLRSQLSEQQLDELMVAAEKEGHKGAVQKLVSFGSDVLANVIAGIVSNPGLYG